MSENASSLQSMLGLDSLSMFGDDEDEGPCDCSVSVDDGTLIVDADDCSGDLAESDTCRQTVIDELTDRGVEQIHVHRSGREYRYEQEGVDLLTASGRFIELVGDRDERLAAEAARDPLSVAEDLRSRVGPIADIGIESELISAGSGVDSYDQVLSPFVGLTVANYYVDRSMAEDARLAEVRELETGSEARIYERSDSVPFYSLDLVDLSLSSEERTILMDAYEAIANGIVEGERAASRAIKHVTDEDVDPVLTSVLAKHTQGYGILEDIFADPSVTDIYVTSPVGANPVRVVVDGQAMTTNVYITEKGVGALASRIRRTSGRAFSRASPTVDAKADLENGTGVRIAGVTDPVSEGVAFAFREQADDKFTLPGLVANDTMPAEAAAFLSVAIERNAAALIAGTRGAGKTTLLGTLLYELSPDTRTVIIEDTLELPVNPLQEVDRDIQALRTGAGSGPEISAADALKTALRLGDGALVVGEIRGEEAQVLYEAMRVGANANAVLGTIHGDGADSVFERVVSDLDVPPSSFGATDLVVTVQAYKTPNGRKRRLSAIEEVMVREDGIYFESLYEIEGDQAKPTGRIDRGESRLIHRLTGPAEEYADIRADIEEREEFIDDLAKDGVTGPHEVAPAYADHRQG